MLINKTTTRNIFNKKQYFIKNVYFKTELTSLCYLKITLNNFMNEGYCILYTVKNYIYQSS